LELAAGKELEKQAPRFKHMFPHGESDAPTTAMGAEQFFGVLHTLSTIVPVMYRLHVTSMWICVF